MAQHGAGMDACCARCVTHMFAAHHRGRCSFATSLAIPLHVHANSSLYGNLFGTPCVVGNAATFIGQHFCAVPAGCQADVSTLLSCRGFAGTVLDLSGMGLTAVAQGAFDGLVSVQGVSVAGNGLQQLPHSILRGMMSLTQL